MCRMMRPTHNVCSKLRLDKSLWSSVVHTPWKIGLASSLPAVNAADFVTGLVQTNGLLDHHPNSDELCFNQSHNLEHRCVQSSPCTQAGDVAKVHSRFD